jgi:Flp pilus assembly pilin Flp
VRDAPHPSKRGAKRSKDLRIAHAGDAIQFARYYAGKEIAPRCVVEFAYRALLKGRTMLYTAITALWIRSRREQGQTMAEYAIVLAVISIAIIAAIGLLGTNISRALSGIASKV